MALSICNVCTDRRAKDTTPYGEPGFPAACYEDDMRVMRVPIHWHEAYEFITAVAGDVTVDLNTDRLVLREGEAVFINSGCLHAVDSVTDGTSVLRSLVIRPSLVGGSADSRIRQQLVAPLEREGAPEYIPICGGTAWQREVIDRMLGAWSAIADEVYDYENEARYLIAGAMRRMLEHGTCDNAGSRGNTLTVTRMKRLLAYIDEHYMEDLSNAELMAICDCSESVLLRCFKQTVGMPPMRYVLRRRIDKAAELLVSTTERSAVIAEICGFHDPSYFTRVFRREIGMTPARFRSGNR